MLKLVKKDVNEAEKETVIYQHYCTVFAKADIDGVVNIPYFMRARNKVDSIKARGELDSEYKRVIKEQKGVKNGK